MRTEQISERRSRHARIGAAACFLFTGVISASWASRVPAIKDGLDLSDGQYAIALLGLEAGAVIGLQLGGLVVPRTGSRKALIASLLAFSGALLGPAFAPSLPVLAASLFLFAAFNSVVDVAMNAQGVAVQRLMGRPVLSGMHAMHSFGGVLGAGAGALAARLGVAPSPHFLVCAVVVVVVGLGVTPVLLPSRVDAEDQSGDGSASTGGLRRWFSGWSVPIALLGTLAFCFTLAEGAGLNLVGYLRRGLFGRNRGSRRGRPGRLPGSGDVGTAGGRPPRLPLRPCEGVPGIHAAHNMSWAKYVHPRVGEHSPDIRPGGVMQDSGYGLPRIIFPGTWVNKDDNKGRSAGTLLLACTDIERYTFLTP